MNALIVYESLFGNTEEIARAIADGVSRHVPVDVFEVTEVPEGKETGAQLLVFGGPTHAFSMSRESTREDAVRQGATHTETGVGIREWLTGLHPSAQSAPIATFDTKVGKMRHLPGSAAKKAEKLAHRHGFKSLVSPESFFVDDVDGPLLDGELERATAWGDSLGAKTTGSGE